MEDTKTLYSLRQTTVISVSAEFLPILPKIFGNCAFSQNLHTRKLAKIMVFYTVIVIATQ